MNVNSAAFLLPNSNVIAARFRRSLITKWHFRLAIWTLLALLAPLQQVAGQAKPGLEGGLSSYFFSDTLKLEWPDINPNSLEFNIVKVRMLEFPKDLTGMTIYLKSMETPAGYHWEVEESSTEVLNVVTQQEEGATRIAITLGESTKSSDGLLLKIKCLDAQGNALPIRQAARKGIVVTINIDFRFSGPLTEEKRVSFEELQERSDMPNDTPVDDGQIGGHQQPQQSGHQEGSEFSPIESPIFNDPSIVPATPTLGAHALLEIRDLNGRFMGNFLQEGPHSERTAFQNLATGIYLIVDPLGVMKTRKVWKLQD